MQISKKDRLELNALSKEAFGTSSRWQKLVDKGYLEVVTEEKTETVVPEKEGDPTTKTTQVPVLTSFGARQMTKKRHTVDSIKEHMVSFKKQFDELKEKIRQQQEKVKATQEAAQKAKLAIEDSVGSAIE